jgi:hypothetical protein
MLLPHSEGLLEFPDIFIIKIKEINRLLNILKNKMSEKKSILAETLEGIQSVKQQIEENANFALTSTLKDELTAIIKEGIADDIETDEPQDMPGDDAPGDLPPTDDAPATDDVPSLQDPAGEPAADGEEVIDLTGATPEEVVASFKLMAPTDEIEIVKTDNGVALNFGNDEAAQTPAADAVGGADTISLEECDDMAEETVTEKVEESKEEVDESADAVFEIEITDDEETVEEAMSHHVGMKQRNIAHNGNDPLRVDETEATEEAPVTETEEKVEETVEETVTESHDKLVAARKKISQLTLENKKIKSELASINENVEKFQALEEEYKQAISKLRTELQEVAVFTSNMTYAVKLMTENTTTKDEKIEILKRLDSAKSITESRETYKVLSESYKGSKSTKAEQIIEGKILADEKTSGASQINETTVYKNEGVDRIKEIISKMKY